MDIAVERPRPIPGRYYFDPGIYEREKAAIFYRSWQYAGHLSMLPAPGSFIVRQIMDQSIAIVRGQDGALRAFHNVCQHRAHRLLEGEGRLGSAVITCPYHAWAYDLEGKLRQARGTEKVAGFRKDRVCLSAVRLAERSGFLFVNLDPDAPAFKEVAGPLFTEVESYSPHAAQLQLARRYEVQLGANWKN